MGEARAPGHTQHLGRTREGQLPSTALLRPSQPRAGLREGSGIKVRITSKTRMIPFLGLGLAVPPGAVPACIICSHIRARSQAPHDGRGGQGTFSFLVGVAAPCHSS